MALAPSTCRPPGDRTGLKARPYIGASTRKGHPQRTRRNKYTSSRIYPEEEHKIALRFAHQTLLWVSAHGPENLPQTLKEVAEAGFRGVEICEPLEAVGGPDQFQFALDDNNLELASISCGFGTDLKDKEKLQEIQARIDFASRFAVDSVMLCGGWYDRGTRKEDSAFRELADACENVAFYAEKYNMRVAFHNHVGSLVETIDDVERLLGMSKSIGLCLDTAPIAVVERFPDKVIYCHLKDWYSGVAKLEDDDYWKGFVELGAGNAGIDFARFLDTLESQTKTQWVAVELDKTGTTPLESAKINHEFLVGLGRLPA
jgi:inosose dehydratase